MSKAVSADEYHSKDFEWDDLRLDVENDPSLSYHLSPFQPSLSSSPSSNAWSLFHSRHSSGKFFKERRYLLKEFPELLSCKDYSKVLEVGCGNGSTVLPILRAKAKTIVYACDCSIEALERAKQNLIYADLECVMDCFHTFCSDFSTNQFPKWLACESCRNEWSQKLLHSDSEANENEGTLSNSHSMKDSSCCIGGVDYVTLASTDPKLVTTALKHNLKWVQRAAPTTVLGASYSINEVFTLSAVPPEKMAKAVMECFAVLKPGGLLLFRDYGLFDMTMLRFEPEKRLDFRHYMRADGTLSYFFDLDGTRDLFVGAGFTELELEYCCVKSVNRQKCKSMRRVWVHGKFQKPL